LATVRIYKVAELLGTTSQEVLALLKRDHGIELKSASSSIEEVVARSFVERVARQRSVALPSGDMFSDTPAPAKGGGKKSAAIKKAEPPKPAAPTLGPPRLVKTIRPPTPAPVEEAPEQETEAAAAPEMAHEPEAPAPVAAASAGLTLAARRPVSRIEPIVDVPEVIDFPRDITEVPTR